jgi:cyclopropane-fatty-acyl-phospholipid synthase
MATKYPGSKVFALSNSTTQKDFIMEMANAKGLKNVTVFTGDVSVFDRDDWKGKFDRVISIGK